MYISGMYAGGEIPVPHLPTLLLVCCDHSAPDSSEISYKCTGMNLVVHTNTCQIKSQSATPNTFCDT